VGLAVALGAAADLGCTAYTGISSRSDGSVLLTYSGTFSSGVMSCTEAQGGLWCTERPVHKGALPPGVVDDGEACRRLAAALAGADQKASEVARRNCLETIAGGSNPEFTSCVRQAETSAGYAQCGKLYR
jgi:hypothetical protein